MNRTNLAFPTFRIQRFEEPDAPPNSVERTLTEYDDDFLDTNQEPDQNTNIEQNSYFQYCTDCPRSSDPFYIVSYYIKWVTLLGHTVQETIDF